MVNSTAVKAAELEKIFNLPIIAQARHNKNKKTSFHSTPKQSLLLKVPFYQTYQKVI
jgi:hypothetical protein